MRRVDALSLEVTTTAGVLDCAIVDAKRLLNNLQRRVRAGILYQCYQSNDITSYRIAMAASSAAPYFIIRA